MSDCLGLYVEDNLIKYAKVTKDSKTTKIDAFGIKFYQDNIDETIEQIIKETFSYTTPISINIENEKYKYSKLFKLLSKKDLLRAIDTEFDYFCDESGKNKLTTEHRTVISEDDEDSDKLSIIYAYTDKVNVVGKIQTLDGYKIKNISPTSFCIKNLLGDNIQENTVIVNIEGNTQITTLVKGKTHNVEILELGMNQIIEDIALKENSKVKAYEICKNFTAYTMAGQDLQLEENEYADGIMSRIKEILIKVGDTIEKQNIEIKNLYITGLGTVINNIDLLFQENFLEQKCEILKPYFIEKSNLALNIKDYIEVNSAIALALQVLDKRQENINFMSQNESLGSFKDLLTADVERLNLKEISWKNIFKFQGKKEASDNLERAMLRTIIGLIILIILYLILTICISKELNKKNQETQEVIDDTNKKIAQIDEKTKLIDSKTSKYEKIVQQLQETNDKITESYTSKNAIPNLLNQIMFAIPKEVQILSIQNTDNKHIIIHAQSEEYQYLGYFKSSLQAKSILFNVTSTTGTREGDMIKVMIEGELPY